MNIQLFDRVRLVDGRIGSVVEIYGGGSGYHIDFGEDDEIITSDLIADIVQHAT